jgi:hypothetical protein
MIIKGTISFFAPAEIMFDLPAFVDFPAGLAIQQ